MSAKDPVATESAAPAAPAHDEHQVPTTVDLPRGWKYKTVSIFGKRIWYASPHVQLIMVAFVCFMCPGMFNALTGMGGGGKADHTLADNMNTALYATFAVFGFFGGTFINKLGVKYTLAFGGIGYGIYAISLLVSVHKEVPGFNIFAGVFLGLCAGLLWTAQGTIMVSYPNENMKGHFFAIFWAIFNMGAVIGSLILLGQNIDVTANATVGDGTYIGFIILMFLGAVIAMLLCNADDIVRDDGTRVILKKNPTWQSEIYGLWETLRFEPFVILLFPMFFSSNWFYVYQFNALNGSYFNTRTKALNSCLYWTMQIISAWIFGYLLDLENIRRTVRAKVLYVVLFVLTFAIWGGGYVVERMYTRESIALDSFVAKDWTHDGYVGLMFLYMFYGFYDAAWQASIYWYMGSLSNSGRRSANFVGFYKGIQSVGAAIVNNLDSRKLSFKAEFISNWVLLGASLVFAAPVIFYKIKDTVPTEEDLQNTGETLEDVLPEGHREKVALGA